MKFNILMGVNIMKGLIISLVVLVVLTVIAIPIYSKDKDKDKGGSNLRVIDATGLTLGEVVGAGFSGEVAQVATTIGGEFVILEVRRLNVIGPNAHVRFEYDDCMGQGFMSQGSNSLMLIAVVDVDDSVYKVLDRNPALLKDFTVESQLIFSGCIDSSFALTDMLPATRIGDLTEFTTPFEFSE